MRCHSSAAEGRLWLYTSEHCFKAVCSRSLFPPCDPGPGLVRPVALLYELIGEAETKELRLLFTLQMPVELGLGQAVAKNLELNPRLPHGMAGTQLLEPSPTSSHRAY